MSVKSKNMDITTSATWESLYRQVGIPTPPPVKMHNISRLARSNIVAKLRTNPSLVRNGNETLKRREQRNSSRSTKPKECFGVSSKADNMKRCVHNPDEVNCGDNVASILLTNQNVGRRKGVFPGNSRRPVSGKCSIPNSHNLPPHFNMVVYKKGHPPTGQNTSNNDSRTTPMASRRPATAKNRPMQPLTSAMYSPISKSCSALIPCAVDAPLKRNPRPASALSAKSSCLQALTLSRKYNEATVRNGYTSPALSVARSSSQDSLDKLKVHRQFSNSTTLHCCFPLLDRTFVLKGQSWNDIDDPSFDSTVGPQHFISYSSADSDIVGVLAAR